MQGTVSFGSGCKMGSKLCFLRAVHYGKGRSSQRAMECMLGLRSLGKLAEQETTRKFGSLRDHMSKSSEGSLDACGPQVGSAVGMGSRQVSRGPTRGRSPRHSTPTPCTNSRPFAEESHWQCAYLTLPQPEALQIGCSRVLTRIKVALKERIPQLHVCICHACLVQFRQASSVQQVQGLTQEHLGLTQEHLGGLGRTHCGFRLTTLQVGFAKQRPGKFVRCFLDAHAAECKLPVMPNHTPWI